MDDNRGAINDMDDNGAVVENKTIAQLSYREFYVLSQALAKEQLLLTLRQSIEQNLMALAHEKNGILKAYGLPTDKPIKLDETTGMVISDDTN